MGFPEAIWLEMDQIFALAPSMRPPMLPVVSRQKTTSTFGFFTSGFLSWADSETVRPKAARAASVQRIVVRIMVTCPRVDEPRKSLPLLDDPASRKFAQPNSPSS